MATFDADHPIAFLPRVERSDIDDLIARLGPLAHRRVATGFVLLFDAWLEHPTWLRRGTAVSMADTALPPVISLGDDCRIMGNILDHKGPGYVVAQLERFNRPVAGAQNTLVHAYAPTLGDALALTISHADRTCPHLEAGLVRGEETSAITVRPLLDLGPTWPFVATAAAFWIFRFVEPFARADAPRTMIEFGFEDEAWRRCLANSIDCSLHFRGDAMRIVIPTSWLAQTNPLHDPALWRLAQDNLATLEAVLGDPDVVLRIRSYVRAALRQERRAPQMKDAATAAGKSPRTLTRDLAAAGRTFSEIMDEERRTLASNLILDRKRTLQELSEDLGFADRASFGRKFRAWFGVPPGHYRDVAISVSHSGPPGSLC